MSKKPEHEQPKYQITSRCTSCERCVAICPTQSIYFGLNHFVIDPDTCDGSKICVKVCPEDAIVPLHPIIDEEEEA